MIRDTFWKIVQRSKDKFPNAHDKQLEFIKKELYCLDMEELIAFDKIFSKNGIELLE